LGANLGSVWLIVDIQDPITLDLPRTLWTCPERWTALGANFPSYWTCPERWTALGANFPSYVAIAGLGAPMDFMNSAGVLLPMELWGR